MNKTAKLYILWWELAAAIRCTVGKERTFCKYTYPAYNLCSTIFFGCVILGCCCCCIASNTRGYLVYRDANTQNPPVRYIPWLKNKKSLIPVYIQTYGSACRIWTLRRNDDLACVLHTIINIVNYCVIQPYRWLRVNLVWWPLNYALMKLNKAQSLYACDVNALINVSKSPLAER